MDRRAGVIHYQCTGHLSSAPRTQSGDRVDIELFRTGAHHRITEESKRGDVVSKKYLTAAVSFAFLCGSAMAQDAKTVIANAQKALGDVKSITYSGTAKDVSFQQCGANSTDMNCRGTHDPMRPI